MEMKENEKCVLEHYFSIEEFLDEYELEYSDENENLMILYINKNSGLNLKDQILDYIANMDISPNKIINNINLLQEIVDDLSEIR